MPEVVAEWNVIDPALGPWVASRDARHRHGRPTHSTVLLDRTDGIGRTGGVILANFAVQRRDHCAIGHERGDRSVARNEGQSTRALVQSKVGATCCRGGESAHVVVFTSPRATSLRRVAKLAVAAGGKARTTTSVPTGTLGSSSKHTAFSRRRTWFLTTADPICLLTIKPKRGADASVPRVAYVTVFAPALRAPRLTTRL